MSVRFARERVRHELMVRRLRVIGSETVAAGMQRVTLGGDELAGFVSPGPGDHVKMFFPDPATGVLTVPTPGAQGLRTAEGGGTVIVRDYTPKAVRTGADGIEVDIDFYIHGDDGPASAWASRVTSGDEAVIAGPRGSLLPPTDLDEAVIVADESALPAAARWLETLGAAGQEVRVTGLFSVADASTSEYLAEFEGAGHDLRWFSGEDREASLAAALKAIQPTDGTFFFLAGEATSLIPLRRYLRRELELPKEQVEVHGYWKRGVVALDHHAPLDPGDPED